MVMCLNAVHGQNRNFNFRDSTSHVSIKDSDSTKTKRVEIINTDVFIFETTDSNTLRKFNGNVFFRHEGTDFHCNRALQYMNEEIMVATGNVHIQKPDSFDIWSDYLVYYSRLKLAKFRDNVIFQDSSARLLTDSLDYNLDTDIGEFWGGGRFETDSSTLTSDEGVYYQSQNEAFFYGNVHLSNPDFDLYSDSMRYDTEEKIAYFIAPTKIINGPDVIYCETGYFDTENNVAQFGGNTKMNSGSTKILAQELIYDSDLGYGEATGNVIWEDTSEQITIIANYIEYKDSLDYVLATDNPLLIDITDEDTLYLSADTLITFLEPYNIITLQYLDTILTEVDIIDTIMEILNVGFLDSLHLIDTTYIIDTSIRIDTSYIVDTTQDNTNEALLDSMKTVTLDTIILIDTTNHIDTIVKINKQAYLEILKQIDTTYRIDSSIRIDTSYLVDTLVQVDSARVFRAFKDTKMLNGRMSGICDSLYFSTKDSTFKMYQNPIMWVDTTQFSGDSLKMVLKNKNVDRIYIYKNAFIIHESAPDIFDQTKGKQITGIFKKGDIEYMVIIGNGESIYFIEDDSSAYVGGNKTLCSKMIIYMKKNKNEIDDITFITKPEATFTPFGMINLASYRLDGFLWEYHNKPKTVEDVVRYMPLYEYYLQYLADKANYPRNETLKEEVIFFDSKSETIQPKKKEGQLK